MYFTGLHITDGGYMAQDISSSKTVFFNDTGAVERIKTYCIGGMFAEGSQVVDSLFFVFGRLPLRKIKMSAHPALISRFRLICIKRKKQTAC